MSTTTLHIDFVSDISCPWCAIGLSALEFVKVAGANSIVLDINEARLAFCKNTMGVDHTIVARGDGEYEAQGRLTIRDRTRDVPLRFRFTRSAAGAAVLEGRATLRRLEFGIGAEGDWRDTRWVGDEVEVRFELRLRGAG